MSEATGTICRISKLQDILHKSIHRYAIHLDRNQFESAAIEIGRIAQIGSELVDLEFKMSDELHEMKHTYEVNREA